jgi:hypothetical protein
MKEGLFAFPTLANRELVSSEMLTMLQCCYHAANPSKLFLG